MAQEFVLDYFVIKNTLARYCFALDNKDFGLLSDVFTPDVDATYPFPGGNLKGVNAVASAISKRLEPITSQHALTTQSIYVRQDGKTAYAVTYFTGIHFGTGKWEGQNLTAYGKYHDELVRLSDGKWRVSAREVTFMGRVGEEGVMTPLDSR